MAITDEDLLASFPKFQSRQISDEDLLETFPRFERPSLGKFRQQVPAQPEPQPPTTDVAHQASKGTGIVDFAKKVGKTFLDSSVLGNTAVVAEGAKDVARNTLGAVQGVSEVLARGSEAKRDIMPPEHRMWSETGGTELLQNIASGLKNATESDLLKPDDSIQRPDGFSGYVYDVQKQAPQVAAQMAATLAGGPVGGGAFMGSQIVGSTYEQARKEGASPERALTAGVVNAAIQTPMEQFSLGKFLKAFRADKMGIKFLESAGTEFVTEFLQEYPDEAAALWARTEGMSNSDRVKVFLDNIGETTKEGLYSGLVSLPFSAVGAGVGIAAQKRAQQQQSESKIPSPSLYDAIVTQESSGDHTAVNPDSGARGNIQWMPETWAAEAQNALGDNAPSIEQASPEQQDQVARAYISRLEQKYGDPRYVAAAIYAGKGYADSLVTGKPLFDPDGRMGKDGYLNSDGEYPSVNEYIAQVMGRMGGQITAGDTLRQGQGIRSDDSSSSPQWQEITFGKMDKGTAGQIMNFAQEKNAISQDAAEVAFLDDALARGDQKALGEIAVRYEAELRPMVEAKVQPAQSLAQSQAQVDSSAQVNQVTKLGIQEIIRRGKEAVRNVINNHTDVIDAIQRPDLGSVSFYWGNSKGGIKHIIERRNAQGYDGQAIAELMPEVIINGEKGEIYGPPGGERINISHAGHTAVLSLFKNGNRNTWLLTGWEDYKEAPNAASEGYGSRGATHSGPMRTRPGMAETSYEPTIPSNIFEVNDREAAMREDSKTKFSQGQANTANTAHTNSQTSQFRSFSLGKSQESNDSAISPESNIAHGQEAINKVLDTKSDVQNAMYRPETGWIEFVWGNEGTADKDFENGFGIAKIFRKHGIDDLKRIPEVIAKGKAELSKTKDRVYFTLDDTMAVVRLTWDGKERVWLLTGFTKGQNKKPPVSPEDVGPSGTTLGERSFAEGAEASLAHSVPQSKTLFQSEEKFTTDTSNHKNPDIRYSNDQDTHTSQFRPFTFGKEPQYGITHEITLGDGTVERFRFIPEGSYTKEEQSISELGSFMGVPVRFFVARKELRGFHDTDTGISYINRNGNRGIEWAFWHENLHWMKGQDSALYQALLADVQASGVITQEQIDAYRQTIALGDQLSDVAVIEEMLADEFADTAKRQSWLQQLQQRDGNLFGRFVAWIKSLVSTMKHSVKAGENSQLTIEQVQAFEGAARRTLLSMRDADGNRLFTDEKAFPRVPAPAEAVQHSSGDKGINQFISKSLQDKQLQQTLFLRPVTVAEAELIKGKIGIDVNGYSHYLNAADLRHIINKHGVHAENSSDQIPLTEKDLEQIPNILSSPQGIQKGNPTQREGLPTIRYIKSDGDGVYTVVEVIHGRNKQLVVKTMWKKSTARHRASNADPLHTSTSVSTLTPGGGSTSSNESNQAQSRGLQLPKEEILNKDSVTSIVPQSKKDVNDSSVESESTSFAKQLDDWAAGKLHPRRTIMVGKTPDVLLQFGAKQLPVEISQKVIAKIVNQAGVNGGKHGLDMDVLKRLPEQLNDPVMVFQSATTKDAVVVLTEMVDKKGDSVITAIHLDVQHKSHMVNAIASVYGKENAVNFVQKQIEAGRLLYAHKEKSRDWLRSGRLYSPPEVAQHHDSINNIVQQSKKDVNDGNPDNATKEERGIDITEELPSPALETGDSAADEATVDPSSAEGEVHIDNWQQKVPSVNEGSPVPSKDANVSDEEAVPPPANGRTRYSIGESKGYADLGRQVEITTINPIFQGYDWRELRHKRNFPQTIKQQVLSKSPIVNRETGWKIFITGDSFDHLLNSGKGGEIENRQAIEHYEIIPHIPALLERAALIESHADIYGREEITKVHRFYAPVEINDNLLVVKLTALEYQDRRLWINGLPETYRLYDHSITKKIPVGTSRTLHVSKDSVISGPATGISTISVREMLGDVNNGHLGETVDEKQPKFSLSSSIGDSALDKLKKKLNLKPSEATVTVKYHDTGNSIGFKTRWFNSVSVIAKEYPKLKPLVNIATKARETQEDLRQHFKHRADKWTKVLKQGDYTENKGSWMSLLWQGDALEKDFTAEELRAAGYNEHVITAYRMTRAAIKHAYKLANDVRQENRIYNVHISKAELEALKKRPFREVLAEKEIGTDQYLATYRAPRIREREGTLSKPELESMRGDPNIHIISEKPHGVLQYVMPEASGLTRGENFYDVRWEEQKPPIGNRAGYIPHFFHEWFIMEKQANPDTGEVTQRMLGSGKTMREAVRKANELAKGLVQGEIVVQPKQFQFPGAAEQAAVIGDKDYFKMVQKVADDLSISLQDANRFLSDKVHMKNRHRFVGNFKQRTGAKGFEQNLDWVLSHYFNMIGRYVALDPFKHEAISRFNRIYGDYDGNHSGEAKYVREFIDDVLGVPTQIEKDLNAWIAKYPMFRATLGSIFGDRPSLQIASTLTGLSSALKLNFLNVASTMLQLTQFINLAGSINSYEYALQGVKRAFKPNMQDKMILHRSGIQSSLGLDNAAGYSKSGVNRWIQTSTLSFRYADGLIRRASVLAAYQQALDQGKTKAEALEYAKDINQKANFEYAVDNAPAIFRRGGPASQVLLQFQKFPIMQAEYMWDMLKNGSTGQKARFFAPYFFLSGIWGVPFVDLFGTLLGGLLGEDWEKELKKATFEWASEGMLPNESKALVRWLWYGGPPGVDVGGRIGIGGFGTARMPKDVREGLGRMFGVAGDTVYHAIRHFSQGNNIEAIKAITPGVGNILHAVAGETKGKRGRTQTRYEEGMSRVIKALGFMPVDESVERDKSWIINAEKQQLRDTVSAAIDTYLSAEASQDEKAKAKARERLRELRITPEQVARERAQKRKSNAERTDRAIPRKYRSEFRQLQGFH